MTTEIDAMIAAQKAADVAKEKAIIYRKSLLEQLDAVCRIVGKIPHDEFPQNLVARKPRVNNAETVEP